jgi:DNA-directed RNA polymerase specialized sigma24 family protein
VADVPHVDEWTWTEVRFVLREEDSARSDLAWTWLVTRFIGPMEHTLVAQGTPYQDIGEILQAVCVEVLTRLDEGTLELPVNELQFRAWLRRCLRFQILAFYRMWTHGGRQEVILDWHTETAEAEARFDTWLRGLFVRLDSRLEQVLKEMDLDEAQWAILIRPHVENMTDSDIAAELNRDEITPPSGVEWTKGNVAQVRKRLRRKIKARLGAADQHPGG